MRGQIGPCGCTSDPLGDLSRTAKVITDARARGPVLVVDAGSLLYAKSPIPPPLAFQEDAKAKLLVRSYQEPLQVAAIGLGPADLANGVASITPPRQAVNATEGPLEAPKVVTVGSTTVGIFGVIAADTIAAKVSDPIAAGKAAVKELRGKSATIIVALVQASTKKDAVTLVRDIGGIDLAIAGLGINAPEPDRVEVAQQVGDTWLVVPANRGQVLARVDVTLRPGAGMVDAIGPSVAEARQVNIAKQLAELDADIAKFQQDPSADPKFLAQKRDEKVRLAGERDGLARQPYVIPATGSYFTLDHIRINKQLACDQGVQQGVSDFYRTTGEANVLAAAGKPVSAPAKGQARYVGMAACDDCHPDEVKQWKTTVHAQAWKTLVDRGQQFDYDCIGCHVTGWDKPGGANLAHNDELRDVQCETCHGPGSIHVDKGGVEKPAAIAKAPPPDMCATQCHTKEHSDTFQYEAYLRDIVAEGHGIDRRKALGDGPTGHTLRSAALDKAGRTLGSGCVR
ncbi:MAG: multiheme c-type cytochrome [Proteobacteria bacterium]|nr:multiheme c-type cytochrome [Pseudomonadota bacterium]